MKPNKTNGQRRIGNRRQKQSDAGVEPSRQVVPDGNDTSELPDSRALLVAARIDVGLGNALFIRGEGAGLSWERGQRMTCVEPAKWVWLAKQAECRAVFKLLLNDESWAHGDNMVGEPGRAIEVTPRF